MVMIMRVMFITFIIRGDGTDCYMEVSELARPKEHCMAVP